MNSDEQCINSDFCLMYSELIWNYCSRVEKNKKREIWKRNNQLNPNTHIKSSIPLTPNC